MTVTTGATQCKEGWGLGLGRLSLKSRVQIIRPYIKPGAVPHDCNPIASKAIWGDRTVIRSCWAASLAYAVVNNKEI